MKHVCVMRGPIRGFVAIFVMALIVMGTSTAQEPSERDARLAARLAAVALDTLVSPEWARAIYDGHAEGLADAIATDPESPFVPLFLAEFDRTLQWVADPEALSQSIDRLDIAAIENGYNRIALTRRAMWRADRRGQTAQADDLYSRLPLIREFRVLGPLAWPNEASIHLPTVPEFTPEPLSVREFATPWGPRNWQSVKLDPGRRQQYLDVSSRLGAVRGSGYFSAVSLVVDGASSQRVILHLGAREAVKIIIDGATIAAVDAFLGERPHAISLPMTLSPGRHTVLLKTANDPSFTALLTDDHGNWPATVRVDFDVPAGIASGTVRDAASTPQPVGAWAAAEALLAQAPSFAAPLLLASMARADVGLVDSATTLAQAAHAAEETAISAWWLASCLQRHAHYPDAVRQREAKALYELALRLDADFTPAMFQLASEAVTTDRIEDARELLDRAATTAPENLRSALQYRDILSRKNLGTLEHEWMSEWRDRAPNNPAVWHYFVEFYERHHNLSAAREMVRRRAAQFPHDLDLAVRALDFDEKLGASIEQLTNGYADLVAAYSDREGAWMAAANFHERHRRFIEANEALATLLAQSARDAAPLHHRMARNFFRAGNEELGMAHLRQAVATGHGRHDWRRYLAHREGRDEYAAFARFAPDVSALMADAPSAADFPRAPSVVLFDQEIVRIYPDLSSVVEVTVIRKILTPEGVSLFGAQDYAGELLDAYVIAADGQRFEPTIVGHGLQMPRSMPGAVQVIRYRDQRPAPYDGRYRGGKFYFTDIDRREPIRLTRYVQIRPTTVTLDVKSSAHAPVPMVETDAETGLTTTVYEARDAAAFDVREEFEPDFDDFAPWVEFLTARSGWNALFAFMLSADRPWTLHTAPIRAKAAELTAAVDTRFAKAGNSPVDAAARTEALARAAYDFVTEHVHELSSATPTETLLTGTGEPRNLFLALLSAMGVVADTVQVAPKARVARIDFSNPQPSDFPAVLVRIHLPSPRPAILLAVESRYLPFGYVPMVLGGGMGVFAEPSGCGFVAIPSVDPFVEPRRTTVKFQIAADGRVVCEGQFFRTGVEGASIKSQIIREPDFRKRMIAQQIGGGTVNGFALAEYDFPELETRGSPFVCDFTGAANGMVQRSASEWRVHVGIRPFALVGSLATTPTRQRDMQIGFGPLVFEDRVEWEMPDTLRIAATPRPAALHHPLVTFERRVQRTGQTVSITRRMQIRPGRISAADYPALLAFCREVDALERDVLRLVPFAE